jgi:membrane associated rhomboid family serine protease
VSAPGQRAAWPWVALLATSLGLLASALPAAPHALAYTAVGLEKGQWWRLWTGHFVHYGKAHLWGDLLAFAVWAALVESESRRVLVTTLVIGAPLLSCAFWLACPGLGEYRGLSSLDAALVIELIVLRGFAARAGAAGQGLGPWLTRTVGGRALRAVGWISLGLFALKTAYEYAAGHALLAPDLGRGVQLLPSAHAFGGLLGLAVCLAVQLTPSASPVSRTLRH